MTDLKEVNIRVLNHGATGLKMALCDELPGFVVHANSAEEMDEKIPAALHSFIKLTTGEDTNWVLASDETPPGFDPNTYVARRSKSAVAA